MADFFKAIWQNRKLILELIKNDFKQKYVGNYLGIFWAFIQPAVTILIFWFIFQVGFKAKPVDNFPFILWLVTGMFAWFYFAEALTNATNSIIANSFLVKKMVFRVSILPIIPILSSLIIHIFFLFIIFLMFIIYGYKPNLYWFQLFYYTFAMSVLLLGLSWFTSSVVIFFKDLGQIISIIIQFGFWLTPVFWSVKMIPQKYHWLIRLNPIDYIIEGYRNSLIYHKWFWEDIGMTIYYWSVTTIVLIIGITTFKRLRPHFADVI